MSRKQDFIKDFGRLCEKYDIGDIYTMRYNDVEQTVSIFRCDVFGNTSEEKVNVAMDSKAQMLLDIGKRLV